MVIVWCELREDFRVLRDERIKVVEFCEMQYPVRAAVLRRDWMQRQALLAVQTGSQNFMVFAMILKFFVPCRLRIDWSVRGY